MILTWKLAVTKIGKSNTATSKKIDDDVMLTNCNVIVFFSNLSSICSHPEAGFRTHGLKTYNFQ